MNFVQNEAAVAKLHPILSPGEINSLLHDGIADSDWISDENLRKQRYREAICSGDRKELIRLVHALYRQKELQKETGRKMHICDENFLRDARKLLDTELSMVLEIPLSEISGYVQDFIKSE